MADENTREQVLMHPDYNLMVDDVTTSIRAGVFTPDPKVTHSSRLILNHFPDVEGKAVLDIGCGTGVLGIRALRKSASQVSFSDTDPKALDNTRENLMSNGIKDNIILIQSDLFDNIPGKFDCIIANLPISNTGFNLNEKTQSIALRFLDECKEHINPWWEAVLVRWAFEDMQALTDKLKELNYKYHMIEEESLWYKRYLIKIKF